MKIHCLNPIVDNDCETLILGSIPGKKSLEQGNYYADPDNQFWDIVFRILYPDWDCFKIVDESISFEDRYKLLLGNRIGLWDVINCCDRDGCSDKKITNATINDFEAFFQSFGNINTVIFNGKGRRSAYILFVNEYPNLESTFPNICFKQLNSTSSQKQKQYISRSKRMEKWN